jgi:hypothetical protein
MRNYQIAQETDAQNGGTAEGCVKGLLESSTPIHFMRSKQAPVRGRRLSPRIDHAGSDGPVLRLRWNKTPPHQRQLSPWLFCMLADQGNGLGRRGIISWAPAFSIRGSVEVFLNDLLSPTQFVAVRTWGDYFRSQRQSALDGSPAVVRGIAPSPYREKVIVVTASAPPPPHTKGDNPNANGD